MVSCLLFVSTPSLAYQRFKDGCEDCHGGFRKNPYKSLKTGQNWPSSLHEVHRGSSHMDDDCGTCHQQDGDDTNMSTSRAGYGCSGCHGALVDDSISGAGLRMHHRASGASNCSGCHSTDETAPAEGTKPPYYGTALTKVDDPCNSSGLEDWNGDNLGLDNDGDDLYDGNDPDCSAANTPPEAKFDQEQVECTTSVQFTDQSSDADAGDEVVAWEWDFDGDGEVDSTDKDPLWDFGAPGDFEVTLTVKDMSDEPATATATVSVVANASPTAVFSFTQEGLVVTFSDESTDADGTLTGWAWDFGDGSTSAEQSPTYAYAAAGEYTVTLTVTDDCDASESTTLTVTIGEPQVLFHRGDPNDSGALDITDGIYILNFLFLGGPPPICSESGDVDDDGIINISDGIFVLNFLFLGGAPPVAPGPPGSGPCGPDRPDSPGDLGCDSYTSCQ